MDALRLVSVSAVVLGHAYLTDLAFSRYLEIWRMPLFFFLTGYFWKRGRPFPVSLRARLRSLALPYAAWTVIISLVVLDWYAEDPALRDELLRSGWYGGADQQPPFWAFWFISVLFFVTVLRRLLERLPTAVAWAVGFAGLALAHLMPDSGLARTPLGIGLALPCLLFVLAGEAFRRHGVPRLEAHRTRIGIGLVGGGILAVRAGLVPHNIKYAGFGTPLLTPLTGMLMAAGMVLVFSSTVDRFLNALARATGLGRALRRAIFVLVRTSTVVVLLHGWVLMQAMRVGIEDNLTKFVLALGVSWAVGLVLLATPLSRLLTGVPQQWHPLRRLAAALTRSSAPAPVPAERTS